MVRCRGRRLFWPPAAGSGCAEWGAECGVKVRLEGASEGGSSKVGHRFVKVWQGHARWLGS
eukprot:364952-Chlamydomonas_euryale.AAC.19